MTRTPPKLVVVGHGAAGLAAALSAAEQARGDGVPIDITMPGEIARGRGWRQHELESVVYAA
jgi:thioredoxin reductase